MPSFNRVNWVKVVEHRVQSVHFVCLCESSLLAKSCLGNYKLFQGQTVEAGFMTNAKICGKENKLHTTIIYALYYSH